METYIEFAKGSCSNRANTAPLGYLPTLVDDCIKDKKELYRSYYEYDEALIEYVSQRHTVRDYPGNYYCNRILFDIDLKDEDGEACKEDALEVVDLLHLKYNVAQTAIKIAFSGRGFHVWIPNYLDIVPSNTLPQDIRQLLQENLKDIMDIVDNIFDGARLIRATNTINIKSNLYKIPLTYSELVDMPYEAITEIAKAPRLTFVYPKAPEPAGSEVWSKFKLKQPEPKRESIAATRDFNAANVVSCMQNVYLKDPDDLKGERHITVLRMASAWRRAGLPLDATIAAIRSWWDNDEVIKLVEDTYIKKYTPGCSDHIMMKYCDPVCIYYKDKDYVSEAMDVDQQEEALVQRINTDFSKTSFDLSDMYSLDNKYGFYPGELVTVYGDTGTGKTAWVQNLCVHIKLNVLYLSLEMSDWLMYRRFCQIAANESADQVQTSMMGTYTGIIDECSTSDYKKLLTWNRERTLNIITSRPDINNIRNIVATHKPHVLVVDHIGFLKSNIHDPRARTSQITGFLKDIAIQQDCIVIAVSHIRRPQDGEKLNIHMGKESSSIEQDSDKVIGIDGDQNSSMRTVRSLKSRDEGYFKLNFDVNFDTFRFMQIK